MVGGNWAGVGSFPGTGSNCNCAWTRAGSNINKVNADSDLRLNMTFPEGLSNGTTGSLRGIAVLDSKVKRNRLIWNPHIFHEFLVFRVAIG